MPIKHVSRPDRYNLAGRWRSFSKGAKTDQFNQGRAGVNQGGSLPEREVIFLPLTENGAIDSADLITAALALFTDPRRRRPDSPAPLQILSGRLENRCPPSRFRRADN